MLNWVNVYAPPEKAGVTPGTLTVPPFVNSDWKLTNRSTNGNKYVCYNKDGYGYAELEINNNTVSNLYGNSAVAANEQLPLVTGRSAYCRLRVFGVARDEAEQADVGLAPLSVAMNVTLPTGLALATDDIQDVASVVISALSTVVDNTVEPYGGTLDVSLGAVNI